MFLSEFESFDSIIKTPSQSILWLIQLFNSMSPMNLEQTLPKGGEILSFPYITTQKPVK